MIDLETLLGLVARSLELTPEQILSKKRRDNINDARSIFVHFARLDNHGRQEIIDCIKLTSKSAVNYHVK